MYPYVPKVSRCAKPHISKGIEEKSGRDPFKEASKKKALEMGV